MKNNTGSWYISIFEHSIAALQAFNSKDDENDSIERNNANEL